MMKKTFLQLSCAATVAVLALGPTASAQVIFSDSFSSAASASNYTIQNSTDATPIFGWDYSLMGIPPAPNTTDNSTFGLRTAANIASPATVGGMFFIPNVSVSGDYSMKFDLWMNYVGPLNGGGAGSTEYFTAGVGISGTAWAASTIPSDGTWFAANGDGFGSTTYRVYLDGVSQGSPTGVFDAGTSFAAQGNNAYYTGHFPGGETAPAAQSNPPQSGETDPGALGFAWREVEILKIGDVIDWYIDGLRIASVTNGPIAADKVFIGHWDHASSIAADADFQFHVFDNLRIEVVPEPSTYALGALGLAALAFARRRKK